MKRTIAFVISFTLSFLFFFSSTAMAEEVQRPIPEVRAQSIQAQPVKGNNANSFIPEAENSTQFLKDFITSKKPPVPYTCSKDYIECKINGRDGYWLRGTCAPC